MADPGADGFSLFLDPILRANAEAVHLLYITPKRAEGRLSASGWALTCDWQATTVVQGQRFNPLAAHVVPECSETRRIYVRWLAQTLVPERDINAAFSDSVRQLIEETALAMISGQESVTLEVLSKICEAMPWPGSVPGAPNVRIIDVMASRHRGLSTFAERDEKAMIGLVEAARYALASFQTPELRRLTSADDQLLAKFDGPPMSMQIASAGLGTPASRLAVMFVAALISRRLQTRPNAEQTPIVIALEDLGSLPRIPGLEEALSIGHRHRIYIVASAQSFRQLEARYGEGTALALCASSEVITECAGGARLSAI